MLNAHKTFDVEIHLDGGQKMEVRYISTYINREMQINKVVRCLFEGKDITAVFKRKGENVQSTDMPSQIYMAIENNARNLWEEELNTRRIVA